MSSIFYAPGLQVHVDEPGVGRLTILAPGAPYDGAEHVAQDWACSYYGEELGELLTRITTRALGLTPVGGQLYLPDWMTTEQTARVLLPVLQRAVVLAAAGTDRYERTFTNPAEEPLGPLCTRCGHGPWNPKFTSSECEVRGHHAYGRATGDWSTAEHIHMMRTDSWSHDQKRRQHENAIAAIGRTEADA